MKKVLILVEDLCLGEHVKEIVKKYEPEAEVYIRGSAAEAYPLIMGEIIELLVVDAVLYKDNPADISGIRFVEHIRQLEHYAFVPVILLSVLEDEALYAYSKLHCYGYLEKPFSDVMLEELIKEGLCFHREDCRKSHVCFRQGSVLYPFRVRDIVYIEHHRREMRVCTRKEVITIPYQTCEKTLAELAPYGFALCARGTIVNLDYIYALDTTNHMVTLKEPGGHLELGRKYCSGLKRLFGSGTRMRGNDK